MNAPDLLPKKNAIGECKNNAQRMPTQLLFLVASHPRSSSRDRRPRGQPSVCAPGGCPPPLPTTRVLPQATAAPAASHLSLPRVAALPRGQQPALFLTRPPPPRPVICFCPEWLLFPVASHPRSSSRDRRPCGQPSVSPPRGTQCKHNAQIKQK